MSALKEFAMWVEAELQNIALCPNKCEAHPAIGLNLAYQRHLSTCMTTVGHGTLRGQLAKAQRTENEMADTKDEARSYTFPKTIGACVDRAYQLREKRLKLERQAAEVKSEEEAVKNHVLESFGKSDVEGVRGKIATAGISRRTSGTVKDWDKFYSYVHENRAFDMLHRRLSDAAYRERLDAGESVPGVEPFEVITLSLTKR